MNKYLAEKVDSDLWALSKALWLEERRASNMELYSKGKQFKYLAAERTNNNNICYRAW